MDRGLSIVTVAKACGISKQYLCDIEHGRRTVRIASHTIARLAACLEIPVSDLIARAERLTRTERRAYSDYHRVLRSNTRAEAALEHMNVLKELASNLRIGVVTGKSLPDMRKLVQVLETTISKLDSTLAYRSPRPARWAQVTGDDAKLAPGRRAIDWEKVG